MTRAFPPAWLDTIRAITDPDAEEGEPSWPHTARWQQIENRKHAARGIPPRYAGATTDLDEIRQWALAVLDVPRTAPSLLLTGPTGTGKTHTAYAALRLLSESRRSTVAWRAASTAVFFADQRPREDVTRDRESMFEHYAKAPVLLLDDVGATKNTEWTEETLYRLVDFRYVNCLPSIFTTNLLPGSMGTRLGDRIASRLAEMCRSVVLDGDDLRKAGAR